VTEMAKMTATEMLIHLIFFDVTMAPHYVIVADALVKMNQSKLTVAADVAAVAMMNIV